jgi:hypothetical protein
MILATLIVVAAMGMQRPGSPRRAQHSPIPMGDPEASQPGSLVGFSEVIRFADVSWSDIPDGPGVYIIYDHAEVLYVGADAPSDDDALIARMLGVER